jgi:large subunit ribosomal protein L14e
VPLPSAQYDCYYSLFLLCPTANRFQSHYTMVNTNYVRVGRLVRIIRGPRADKVGVITDIIDATRVLVENPEDNKMWRHVQNVKNIEPLKFNLAISRNSKTATLKSALGEKKTLEKYNATTTAKRIAAKKALVTSTDFERYQLRVAKRSRAHWTRKIFDEADKKKAVSWHAIQLKKLKKSATKFDKKKGAAARVQKAQARSKARLAKKTKA